MKFVKRMINGSNKLTDRVQVMVDYEGQEYRAVETKCIDAYAALATSSAGVLLRKGCWWAVIRNCMYFLNREGLQHIHKKH